MARKHQVYMINKNRTFNFGQKMEKLLIHGLFFVKVWDFVERFFSKAEDALKDYYESVHPS